MRHGKHLLFLFFSLVIMAGCLGQKSGTQAISPLESPVPLTSPVEEPEVFVVPTPAAGTAVVVGVFKVAKTEQPMHGVRVYLGDHIGSTEDTPLYGFDPEVAPSTITDENGRFVFVDVPPGRYVLIIWGSLSPMLARDPGSGLPLDITLEGGDVVDLGTLYESME